MELRSIYEPKKTATLSSKCCLAANKIANKIPTRESVYNAEHVGGKEKYAFQLKGLHRAARANVCMHAARTYFTSAQSQALD